MSKFYGSRVPPGDLFRKIFDFSPFPHNFCTELRNNELQEVLKLYETNTEPSCQSVMSNVIEIPSLNMKLADIFTSSGATDTTDRYLDKLATANCINFAFCNIIVNEIHTKQSLKQITNISVT